MAATLHDDPGQAAQHFFSDQYDLGMEYTGYTDPEAEHGLVVRGDLDAREFIAFSLPDGRW